MGSNPAGRANIPFFFLIFVLYHLPSEILKFQIWEGFATVRIVFFVPGEGQQRKDVTPCNHAAELASVPECCVGPPPIERYGSPLNRARVKKDVPTEISRLQECRNPPRREGPAKKSADIGLRIDEVIGYDLRKHSGSNDLWRATASPLVTLNAEG